MNIKNIEFKARTSHLKDLESKLKTLSPEFKGIDDQTDTYFKVPDGRLKLREGTIENALIHYEREDSAQSKLSDILLFQYPKTEGLKSILLKLFPIDIVVRKTRHIYFIDNVKFHFDEVPSLGTFVEVEAIDTTSTIAQEVLKQQCDYYQEFLGIKEEDFVRYSYSDLLRNK